MCSTRQRLAAMLREHREYLGLSLRRAAEQAQISPSTLSRWESGSCVPRVPELRALLQSYGAQGIDIRRVLVSVGAPRAAKAAKQIVPDPLAVPTGGELLRAMRERAGITQQGVAEHLHVARSTVSRWEASLARPSNEALEQLLHLLNASAAERNTFARSGVAKIRSERGIFHAEHYREKLGRIESTLPTGGERNTELHLLEIQSHLWWARNEAGAVPLLRKVFVLYGRYLAEWGRFAESLRQANRAIESGDPFDEIGMEAQRIVARADVFRGHAVRPHLGLCTLQPCLDRSTDPEYRAWILSDMADYSRLAGRSGEALGYASRAGACVASPEASEYARGAWASASGDREELQRLPDEPWLASEFMFREIEFLETRGRQDEADLVAVELERFLVRHELGNHLARMTRKYAVVNQAAINLS